MISVINEPEISRKKLSKLLIRDAIERSGLKAYPAKNIVGLIRRDSMRAMFINKPKSENERKAVDEFAKSVVLNLDGRFSEIEKNFARMYLYFSYNGMNTDMFFGGNEAASRANARLRSAASVRFMFNEEEDEELV